MEKDIDAFRNIGEVAEDLDLPQHVLRFWETRFTQIKPLKRGGGRRYYRPDDVALVRSIKHLLYAEGYTIKGVQRILKEQGVKAVVTLASGVFEAPGLLQVEPAAAMQSGLATESERPPKPAEGPAHKAYAAFSDLHFRQLEATLAELEECRRVLLAARQP